MIIQWKVRNRFKGLGLIECLMNYGQRFVTLYRRQGSRPSPRKKECRGESWGHIELLGWKQQQSKP